MRHGKKVNHLSRTSSHRKAMLANMACSLIEHKRINTTIAKAKALKKLVQGPKVKIERPPSMEDIPESNSSSGDDDEDGAGGLT